MAKLVDALRSERSSRKGLRVRISPAAHNLIRVSLQEQYTFWIFSSHELENTSKDLAEAPYIRFLTPYPQISNKQIIRTMRLSYACAYRARHEENHHRARGVSRVALCGKHIWSKDNAFSRLRACLRAPHRQAARGQVRKSRRKKK